MPGVWGPEIAREDLPNKDKDQGTKFTRDVCILYGVQCTRVYKPFIECKHNARRVVTRDSGSRSDTFDGIQFHESNKVYGTQHGRAQQKRNVSFPLKVSFSPETHCPNNTD